MKSNSLWPCRFSCGPYFRAEVGPIDKPISSVECAMTTRELAAFHVMLPSNVDGALKCSKQNGTYAHRNFRKKSQTICEPFHVAVRLKRQPAGKSQYNLTKFWSLSSMCFLRSGLISKCLGTGRHADQSVRFNYETSLPTQIMRL